MRKVFILFFILILNFSVAQASVIGTWRTETTDSGLYRHTLNLSSDTFPIITYEIAVLDEDVVFNQTGPISSTTVDEDTHFLLQEWHLESGFPPVSVTDTWQWTTSESSHHISGTISMIPGGIYDGGMMSFDALQIVTLTACDPMTFQTSTPHLDGLAYCLLKISYPGDPTQQVSDPIFIEFVPEPTTFILLYACLGTVLLIRRR